MTGKQLALLRVAARLAEDGTGRQIRVQAKVPMHLIAKSIGVDESTISRWERGQRQPRGEGAIRWADLLNELERSNAKNAA